MDGISRGGRFDQKHSKMMLVVKGLVVGAFGEGSEDLHTLIHHLATSRVRVAGPQKGKRGQVRSEEAELAITTSFLRRTLSTAGVRAQSKLLLNRLEVIGPLPTRTRNAPPPRLNRVKHVLCSRKKLLGAVCVEEFLYL